MWSMLLSHDRQVSPVPYSYMSNLTSHDDTTYFMVEYAAHEHEETAWTWFDLEDFVIILAT